MRTLLLSVVGLVLVLLAFSLVLLFSAPGLRLAMSAISGLAPGVLSAESAEGRLSGPLTLRGLNLNLDGQALRCGQVHLEWRPLRLLQLNELHVDSLVAEDCELTLAESGEQAPAELTLPESVMAPVNVELLSGRVSGLNLITGEQSHRLQEIVLRGRWQGTQVELEQLVARGAGYRIDATLAAELRERYPISLEVDHEVSLSDEHNVLGSLALAGDMNQLKLEGLWLSPLSVELNARLTDPVGDVQITGSMVTGPADLGDWLDIDTLDLSAAELQFQATPAGARVDQFEARLGDAGLLSFAGDVDWRSVLGGEGTLEWQELKLPLADGQTLTTTGRLRVGGNADSYRYEGGGQLTVEAYTAPFSVQGVGTSEQLDTGFEADLAGSRLQGRAELRWREQLAVLFELRAEDLKPELFGSPTTGVVDVDAEIRLAGQVDSLTASVEALSIEGLLGGVGVRATAAGQWSAQEWAVRALEVEAGDSRLSAAASSSGTARWEVSVPSVQALSSTLAPGYEAGLDGRLESSGQLDLDDRQLTGSIRLADASAGGLVFEELTLIAQDQDSGWAATLQARESEWTVLAELGGAWPESQALSGWLQQLVVTPAGEAVDWRLQAPARFNVSARQSDLELACLQRGDDAGRLCLSARSGAASAVQLDLENLPLALAEPWISDEYQLGGLLTGSVAWRIDELPLMSLQGRGVRLGVDSVEGWRDVLMLEEITATATPEGDRLIVEVRDASRDAALATGSVLRVAQAPVERWPFELQTSLRIEDLSPLSLLAPDIDRVNGRAGAELKWFGSISAPQLDGAIWLEVPQLAIPEAGLSLSDSRFDLTANLDSGRWQFRSASGDGGLQGSGELSWADGISLSGELNGERFRLVDTFDAVVDVSPRINVNFSGEALAVSGVVEVPFAEIRPQRLPSGAVLPSKDQRLDVGTPSGTTPLDVTADLRLLLGESVRFEGFGLASRMTGEVTLIERPGFPTRFSGRVNAIGGSYRAYGQDLEIERGSLLFADSPFDVAGVDLRAVRQATPSIKVGIEARGAISAPSLSVFSDPPLPPSDQLAYLIFGRPLEATSENRRSALEQAALALSARSGSYLADRLGGHLPIDEFSVQSAPGTGAEGAELVVGKYFSPRLYVRYGYGLFQPISTLRLEYQLANRWRLISETNNEQTGADIEWVYERE